MRRFIASGLGVGLIPHRLRGSHSGAGTLGAALGGVIGIAAWAAPWWVDAALAAGAMAASVWSARPFAVDGEDPGWVVIDEVAGALVAVVGLTGWPWAVAWSVARLADIYKVLPGVAAAEGLHGAWGVTLDDVVAGGYGLAAGWLVAAMM